MLVAQDQFDTTPVFVSLVLLGLMETAPPAAESDIDGAPMMNIGQGA